MGLNKLFEVRNTESKGLGVFATVKIPIGTLILAERPLLRIQNPYYLKAELQEIFDALTPEQQAKYLSLHSAHGQDPDTYPKKGPMPGLPQKEKQRVLEQHEARTAEEKTVLSIMMTNAMECEGGAAVFELASRFNHSCLPNAVFSWHRKRQEECIRATRDIEEGEEILLSYIDPYYDVSMRKWELKSYGFECDCRACVKCPDDPDDFFSKSVDRRWRLREIDETIYTSDNEKLRAKVEEAALMREEGIVNSNLAQLYLEIARLMDRLGEDKFAVTAAQKALYYYTVCLGEESKSAENAAKSVRAFQKLVPANSDVPKRSST